MGKLDLIILKLLKKCFSIRVSKNETLTIFLCGVLIAYPVPSDYSKWEFFWHYDNSNSVSSPIITTGAQFVAANGCADLLLIKLNHSLSKNYQDT